MKVRKAKDLFLIFSNPEIFFLCSHNQFCLVIVFDHIKGTRDVSSAKVALRQPNIEGVSSKLAQVNSTL